MVLIVMLECAFKIYLNNIPASYVIPRILVEITLLTDVASMYTAVSFNPYDQQRNIIWLELFGIFLRWIIGIEWPS